MGWKINLILSLGALCPFFLILLVISVIELRNRIILELTVSLFLISFLINLYAVKVVRDKEQFNPRQMKIEGVNKMKKGDTWLSVLSTFLTIIPLLSVLSSVSMVDILVLIIVVSSLLILFYTFYEDESVMSQILSIRILFRVFYVAETDTKSTIYLLSKEKIQANSKIKAYHVIGNVYLFAYLTNN